MAKSKFLKGLGMGFRFAWATITFPHFLRKMRKQKQDDEVIICLFPHLGDIVYGLSYAEQYKKETGKKICVFCSSNLEYYVREYKFIDRIILYDATSLDQVYVACFPFLRYGHTRGKNPDGIIATVPDTNHFKGMTALEVYRDCIYNVQKDKLSLYPPQDVPVSAIDDFDNIKDKVVLINPYSFSHGKSDEMFECMAEELKKRGYIVYTNVMNVLNQQPIKGTLPFDCHMFEKYTVVNKISLFISTRSGMLDMMASSQGNLLTIYIKKPKKRDYFSVKELRSEGVREICWQSKKDTPRVIKLMNNFLDEIEAKRSKNVD